MSSFGNRKVLVTGATGLVGSWLVKELIEQNADVTALIFEQEPTSELMRSGDIGKISVRDGDLADLDFICNLVKESESEVIFHLGAQTIVGTALIDPVRTFRSNVQGTWNLLEGVRLNKEQVKSVVVASSDKAYGSAKVLPYNEDFPLKGEGPYDVSKSATDLISQSYAKTYGLPIVIARCGNIYGGGDLNWSRIVPGTIKSLIHNETPVLRSNGKFIRDYVHVEDITHAYLHLAKSAEFSDICGEAYNFSRDEPLSVIDIYRKISEKICGEFVPPKILDEVKSEIQDQHLNSAKARTQLSWESQITLDVGLEKTIDWYQKFFQYGIARQEI